MIDYLKVQNNLFCKYCNKQCKNKNSLIQHQIRCSKNPNKIKSGNPNNLLNYNKKLKSGEVTIWNKGKNKYTNDSIKKGVESLKKTIELKHSKGEKYSKGISNTLSGEILRRQKISKALKNNVNGGGIRINSGRGKKGWYKGFYCRSTYELVYVIYNLNNNIKFEACKRCYPYMWNNVQHLYYPDFELNDGTIIEIKGYSTLQTLAKINAVKDRPIKVLYRQDLQYAFDYVSSHFIYNKLEDLYE